VCPRVRFVNVDFDLAVYNLNASILETRLEGTIIRADIQLGVTLYYTVIHLLLFLFLFASNGALLSLGIQWAAKVFHYIRFNGD